MGEGEEDATVNSWRAPRRAHLAAFGRRLQSARAGACHAYPRSTDSDGAALADGNFDADGDGQRDSLAHRVLYGQPFTDGERYADAINHADCQRDADAGAFDHHRQR